MDLSYHEDMDLSYHQVNLNVQDVHNFHNDQDNLDDRDDQGVHKVRDDRDDQGVHKDQEDVIVLLSISMDLVLLVLELSFLTF
jgi:hypothetical protein